ncbi:FadR/GntR family transcriptional regulator [Zestomonas carbonaria]|uniref:L-lactate dehydrogenase operon regulatory protein n=1 Tax=Zestomonas carbonaria TaxID=2762745 RepID=A0A7U7ET37_9GAMM|nr:FadR/GntR family transcriptional regulator [Pseudomonas carbonaria]CAD5110551.1 Putative L-lactate dehydrogenase operon regulatory protein [Pseudomonas carbonaria]
MFSSSKLVNSVVQKLLDTIEQGRWAAGQMLPGQRELAEQLEISRPSLREAITVLETLGVVRSLPGKGVMVLERDDATFREIRAPATATLEDILQLRYALEPFVAGLVAQTADSTEVGQLRLLLLDMREAVEDGNAAALVEAYSALHRKLVALTSNPIFLSVSQQIGSALEQSDSLVRRNMEYAEDILQEHEAILKAIRQHDSEAASQAMRLHILNEGVRLNISLRVPEA